MPTDLDPFAHAECDQYRGVTVLWIIRDAGNRVIADFKVVPPRESFWKPSETMIDEGLGKVVEIWATRKFPDRLAARHWIVSESHSYIDEKLNFATCQLEDYHGNHDHDHDHDGELPRK